MHEWACVYACMRICGRACVSMCTHKTVHADRQVHAWAHVLSASDNRNTLKRGTFGWSWFIHHATPLEAVFLVAPGDRLIAMAGEEDIRGEKLTKQPCHQKLKL